MWMEDPTPLKRRSQAAQQRRRASAPEMAANLALKLASHEVIGEIGDQPIVLLDDVFAELDADRRRRLAARCAAFEQVLVTAAVGTEVPLEGMRVHIRAGTVIDPPSTGGST